jgi:symplekin
MWTGAAELVGGDMAVDSSQSSGHPTELWMLLLVRMVTRVAEPPREKTGDTDGVISQDLEFYSRHDQLRQTLVGYIMANFSSRYYDAYFVR